MKMTIVNKKNRNSQYSEGIRKSVGKNMSEGKNSPLRPHNKGVRMNSKRGLSGAMSTSSKSSSMSLSMSSEKLKNHVRHVHNGQNYKTQEEESHARLRIVIMCMAVLLVLAILSAFVWPGWAIKKDDVKQHHMSISQRTTPIIKPLPLPKNASALVRAFPDSVLDYARQDVKVETAWENNSPVEEYIVHYARKKDAGILTLHIAQWSHSQQANKQYEELMEALKGKTLAIGKVKVQSEVTGQYAVWEQAINKNKAVSIWQNSTVVCELSGDKNDVLRFYPKFNL